MTIKEFRDKNNMCKVEYKINIPPLIHSFGEVEEIKKN